MKRIGVLAHSAEGAALCFLTAVHEGERRLGAHVHPEILLDATAMGDSMDDWARLDFPPIRKRFAEAIERLKAAGADFFLCPDNTAHMALEAEGEPFALPGLHIQSIVAAEGKAARLRPRRDCRHAVDHGRPDLFARVCVGWPRFAGAATGRPRRGAVHHHGRTGPRRGSRRLARALSPPRCSA